MIFSLIILAEELDSQTRIPPLSTRGKFQKEHGRKRCAVGEEFGIAGE